MLPYNIAPRSNASLPTASAPSSPAAPVPLGNLQPDEGAQELAFWQQAMQANWDQQARAQPVPYCSRMPD
jgi:hypothetical protein